MTTNETNTDQSFREPRARKGRRWIRLTSYAAVGVALAATIGWGAISLSGRPADAATTQGPAVSAAIQTASPSSEVNLAASIVPTVSPAQSVATALGPSVVNVKVTGSGQGASGGTQQYSAEGSGVIYSPEGLIVTNNHVVTTDGTQRVDAVEVTLATGEVLPATIVGTDPLTDLAVLKVISTRSLPAAKFVTEQPSVGEYAVAIGSPLGYANSVTLEY
jgi:putative serine protease PepD